MVFLVILFFSFQGCSPALGSTPISSIQPSLSPPSLTNMPLLLKSWTPSVIETELKKQTEKYTPLPTVDLSNVPPEILRAGDIWSLSANDIVYLVELIKKVARDRNPTLLFDFMQFPLHQNERCPGNIIETKEEFINMFSEIVDEETRFKMMNIEYSDIGISYDGFGIAVNNRYDIAFVPLCDDLECNGTYHIFMNRFLGYTTYWDMVEGYPTPQPTFDASLIKTGIYTPSEYFIKGGKYTLGDDTLLPWKEYKVIITSTSVSTGPFPEILLYPDQKEYETCLYKVMEICPPREEIYNTGNNSKGSVQFICTDSPRIFSFYIFGKDQLGIGIRNSYNFLILNLK
jgi:hypothetical protein